MVCSGTSIWHVESSLENCVEKLRVEQKKSSLKKTVIAVCVLHNNCMKRMTSMARITMIQMTVLTTTTMEELGWEDLFLSLIK